MVARLVMEALGQRERVEQALARINDVAGEGRRTFVRVYEAGARLAADTADAMGRLGVELPALAGLPVSIKDLFDVKGETTTAGSLVLKRSAPAAEDAEVVRRLRHAGAAIVGKTNMTEFAFSGLGLNPHYGTPLNVWDRGKARIPGGSSSGAAISITDGMAIAAIGTDTGGSCRIPAALNGIVGMKPSAQMVPMRGTLPLSPSYDSIGPLAADVQTCARVYAVLSATHYAVRPVAPNRLVVALPKNYVLEQMDVTVASTYEATLQRLSRAGVALREISLPPLDDLPHLFVNGGLVAAEAYAWHRDLLASRGEEYDPRVAVRIRRGGSVSAADYIAIQRRREELVARWATEAQSFDAMVMPTVPIVAPRIEELDEDEAYSRINLLMLRNPTVVNALDGCAVTLPCHMPGSAPVGVTLACPNRRDWHLLSVAAALQECLSPSTPH
jgi:aspartyl-tRNA(Asn)/glutamyl-tRNA(Gln) amidotransferase subunit A